MISRTCAGWFTLLVASGCAALPAPGVPPSAKAPDHFGAPLYRSSGEAPAAYRVFDPEPGCPDDAPVVVFVHGLGDFGYSLAPLAKASAPCATKVIVDLPGLGESPMRANEITSERVIAALVDIIEREARGGRAIVVGHSIGGTLALRLAAKRPDLIAGAVAIAAPLEPFELGDTQRLVLDRWRTLLPALRLWGPYSIMVETYEEQTATRPNPGKVYRALLARQSSRHARFEGAEKLVRTVLGNEAMREMVAEREQIRAPLLFIYGERDGWSPPTPTTFPASSSVAIVDLPGIGHLAHAEAPDAVAARTHEFVEATFRTETLAPGVGPKRTERNFGVLNARRRTPMPAEIDAGDEIYGPQSEIFPVIGFSVLAARGRNDVGPLIGLAKGSVDRAYPLETGRATAFAGILTRSDEEPSYVRLGVRTELVWRWVGGVLLEGSALAGESDFAGFGAVGYVPSLIPWVHAKVGYGALPDLDAGWIFGLEANFALTTLVY